LRHAEAVEWNAELPAARFGRGSELLDADAPADLQADAMDAQLTARVGQELPTFARGNGVPQPVFKLPQQDAVVDHARDDAAEDDAAGLAELAVVQPVDGGPRRDRARQDAES